MRNQNLGAWGEDAAAGWLVGLGYRILDRNVRTRFGEIDIVALRAGELICAEVKTRSGLQFGTPAEAITTRKLEHMRLAAELYVAGSGWDGPVELVVVEVDSGGRCQLITGIELP